MRLTYPAVTKAARAVIAEHGADYNYTEHHPECNYTNDFRGGSSEDDNLGCLIGEIFKKLGLMPPHNHFGAVNSYHIFGFDGRITSDDGHTATPKAFRFMKFAQMAQDAGSTWGKAYHDGVRAAPQR